MKTLLALAATIAAFTSVSAASAQDRGPGRWEWQNRVVHGPSKLPLPRRTRVWVKDTADTANCDCAMMRDEATKAACMDMPHKGKAPSQG